MVDFSDFMLTLVEIAGASLPEKVTIDGRSFFPQLCEEKGNPRDWIFMHYWGRGRDIMKTRRCARNKRWKLYDDGSFFDVKAYPLEQHPIKVEKIIGEPALLKNSLQDVLNALK